MKLCPQCNKNQIEDNYSMCMTCLKETKQANQNVDLTDLIKKINWNLGSISLTQKLTLLNDLETLKCQQGLTKVQQKIHKLLLGKADKDLKSIENITEEQEK